MTSPHWWLCLNQPCQWSPDSVGGPKTPVQSPPSISRDKTGIWTFSASWVLTPLYNRSLHGTSLHLSGMGIAHGHEGDVWWSREEKPGWMGQPTCNKVLFTSWLINIYYWWIFLRKATWEIKCVHTAWSDILINSAGDLFWAGDAPPFAEHYGIASAFGFSSPWMLLTPLGYTRLKFEWWSCKRWLFVCKLSPTYSLRCQSKLQNASDLENLAWKHPDIFERSVGRSKLWKERSPAEWWLGRTRHNHGAGFLSLL